MIACPSDVVLLPRKLLHVPIPLELLDVQPAAQEQGQALVQLGGHDAQDAALAIRALAASLDGE